MNAKEFSINQYLDQIDIQITDPTLKQQEYFESIKHNIHQNKNSFLTSPLILREVGNRMVAQIHHKTHENIHFQNRDNIRIHHNFERHEV